MTEENVSVKKKKRRVRKKRSVVDSAARNLRIII